VYCSEQAFEARFGSKEWGELLPEGEGDDGRSYSAVAADADSLIDSYLAGRYVVPLSPIPKLIIGIAADLIRYRLYDDAPPKEVAARRTNAIKLLEQLRDGEMVLTGVTPVSESGGIAVSARDAVMTEDLMEQYSGCL
jgi:phage gp36-like protein